MERKPIESKYLDNLKVRAQIIQTKEIELKLLTRERDMYALKIRNEMQLPQDERWDINVGDGVFEKVGEE